MYRKINRFNWIACAWILIGLFDLLFGYITYAALMYIYSKNNVDRQIAVTICAVAGLIACLGWLAVSGKFNSHDWIRTNWIGALAIFWGIVHSIAAIFYFLETQRAGGREPAVIVINLLLSAISIFLILSGIYVLRRTDLYLQFRERD